ncbi:MAG: ribonucleoside triphosphate reductase [Sedimentisphaerales bacterium]|nr:ribonucleoside triphosphate reductase [Sedimentisphaerales bacterium]
MGAGKTSPEKTQLAAGSFNFPSIIKRDGRVADFDPGKIERAISKAGTATGEFSLETAGKLTRRVLSLVQATLPESGIEVEQIQDLVEEVLLASPYKKTAKAYIIYRDQHARIRELLDKADLDLIDNYLEKLDWQVQENSNMSYSLQGLNNYISSEVSKTYWLNKIYSPEIRRSHLEGDFHLHDLGLLSVYCVGWDLQELLRSGFQGVAGKVQSKPARHFRTALGQIVNFFYTLQGEAAGAQAFSSIDTLLAPFIYYDKLTYNEVKQSLQEFVFNVNVPTRVGFQTPFTNITLDLQPPATLADSPVIIGGELQDKTYNQFQAEMDMFNRAFLEVMAQGDAHGRVFTFPIPTYNIGRDFNWDNPNLDLLWQVTARYGIPYFANFVNSDMHPEDARSMCCRLRLDLRHLEKRGGGLFGANPLTGSIGVVTINMPRLGHIARDKQDFLSRLDVLLEKAKNSLETKRKLLEQFTIKNLYPYTRYYLRGVFEHYGKFWHNHFSTIGITGMNEACVNLLSENIGSDAGREFALEVMEYIRKRLLQFQEETGNMYNLEATPAEGTSYRLARLDLQRYPQMKCLQDRKLQVYSNSTQLPVDYSSDIWHVLDLQDPLQVCYTGGTVQHIFLGEAVADWQALRCFIRKVCENYHLPYFTISPSFSICPVHGYLSGIQDSCPQCQSRTEIYARVVGYLRPIDQWNQGKQSEFKMRKYYHINPEAIAK